MLDYRPENLYVSTERASYVYPICCYTFKLPEVPKAYKYRGERENGLAAAGRNGLVDGDNLIGFKRPRQSSGRSSWYLLRVNQHV